jgi:hypothetical protein
MGSGSPKRSRPMVTSSEDTPSSAVGSADAQSCVSPSQRCRSSSTIMARRASLRDMESTNAAATAAAAAPLRPALSAPSRPLGSSTSSMPAWASASKPLPSVASSRKRSRGTPKSVASSAVTAW